MMPESKNLVRRVEGALVVAALVCGLNAPHSALAQTRPGAEAAIAAPTPIGAAVRIPSTAERTRVAGQLQAAHVRLLNDPAYLEAFARKDAARVAEMLRRTAGVDWPVPIAIGEGGTGPAGVSFGFACKTYDSFPWIRCWGGVSL